MDLWSDQIKPLARIFFAFGFVWLYHGLTTGLVSGWIQLLVVVVLAFLTWVIFFRYLTALMGESKLD